MVLSGNRIIGLIKILYDIDSFLIVFHTQDPLASYDINSQDPDPTPRYDLLDTNRHGTRCAGEVAATSNNSVCALGIAHGAHIGGNVNKLRI